MSTIFLGGGNPKIKKYMYKGIQKEYMKEVDGKPNAITSSNSPEYQANTKEKKKQVTKMNPQKSPIRKEMPQLLVHTTGQSFFVFFNPSPEKSQLVAH